MKFLKSAFAVTAFALISSCTAVNTTDTATVVKDCTGTYLRMDQKDFQVCNAEILKNYGDGSKVTATFTKVKDCPEFDGAIVCQMYHKKEGLIRVSSIK